MTPFGIPVVPPVYTKMRSSPLGTWSVVSPAGGLAAAIARS